MQKMSMRERMLAYLQGRQHDRVPFIQYDHPELGYPDADETWRVVGYGNVGLLRWVRGHLLVAPNCSTVTEETVCDGKPAIKRTIDTPKGPMYEIQRIESVYGTPGPVRYFVTDEDDYPAFLAYLQDVDVYKNLDPLHAALHELNETGLPHYVLERTPYQQLWIEWMGIEQTTMYLALYPDRFDEICRLLFDIQRRVLDVMCEVLRAEPVPYVVIGDNLTAPVIGDAIFRKYCLPSYKEAAARIAETGKDVPLFVHADGDLRTLWPAFRESPVNGIDSLSPPPDNDTSVADAMREWPQMKIGVNFPSSVHLQPPQEVYEQCLRLLEGGGRQGRLQIQTSENVPPGYWQRNYPEILRAIEDFGPACSAV